MLLLWSLLPHVVDAQVVRSDTAATLLELRLVQAAGEATTHGFAGVDYRLGPPLVSDADVHSVLACVSEGLELLITPTPEGSRRLIEGTEGALGGYLAILVEGRMRSSPALIVSAIGARQVTIGIPATREEAERLVASFRARWPTNRDCESSR